MGQVPALKKVLEILRLNKNPAIGIQLPVITIYIAMAPAKAPYQPPQAELDRRKVRKWAIYLYTAF